MVLPPEGSATGGLREGPGTAQHGRTPLYVASLCGHLEFVKFCVEERGAQVEVETAEGYTAFFVACWRGHLEVTTHEADTIATGR